tara:strand:- start:288 stop:1097 length:810 start_codon:yes stop_codon:yes gene_type:complete
MEEEIAPVEDSGQAETGIQFNPSTMPEGLRDEPSLQTFDSVDKLAKSYVNAVKMIGGNPDNLISVPQEGESWDSFYNQLGRPEQANGYDFGEDVDGVLDDFKTFAHQNNFTQDQADNLLGLFSDMQEEDAQSEEQAIEDLKVQTTIGLQRDWGRNYDGNLDYARRAYAQFGTAELTDVLDNSGFGNHPEVIKAFSKVGQLLGEESLAVGTGLGRDQMSPQMAQEEIQSLYRDKDFSKAYRDNKDPSHKTAMSKMDRLFKNAYPNQKRVR